MVTDIDSGTFEMSQPFLVRRIIEFLSLNEHKTKGCDTLVGKPLLNCNLDGVPCKHPWLYCGAVGMLSYLGNSVRPEIQMAVHQTARFLVIPWDLTSKLLCGSVGISVTTANAGLFTRLTDLKASKYMLMLICGRLEFGWYRKCWQRIITNWLRFLLCKLSLNLVQQASNWNCAIDCRGRIHCDVSCLVRDNSYPKPRQGSQLHVSFAWTYHRFLHYSSWGQSFCHFYGWVVEVHSSHKTYCNQVSSLSQQSSDIV